MKPSLFPDGPSSPLTCPRSVLQFAAATLTLANVVIGEGFRNPPPGSFGLSQSGAKVALVDDASATWINPANLTALEKPEALAEFTLVHIQVSYESPSGTRSSTQEPFKFLPSFFAASPLPATTNLVAALGITSPYGISNEWEPNGAFAAPAGNLRYATPFFAELKTLNIQPTIAFKLNDRIQLGAGFDAMWSELTLKQFYPWFLLPGGAGLDPEGTVRLKGDGTGYGANFGATVKISDNQNLSFTYRTPIQVRYSGTVRMENMPSRGRLFGFDERGPMSTSISFPSILAAGYGFKLNERISIGTDLEWIQFSNFDSLNLQLGPNSPLFPSNQIRQDWRDTFTAGIGGEYRITEQISFRTSYQFYKSPVPDGAYSPTIPDSDQQVFTAGVTCRKGRHEVGLAYGGIFYADRNITAAQNPAVNGRYQIGVHLASGSYRLRF